MKVLSLEKMQVDCDICDKNLCGLTKERNRFCDISPEILPKMFLLVYPEKLCLQNFFLFRTLYFPLSTEPKFALQFARVVVLEVSM